MDFRWILVPTWVHFGSIFGLLGRLGHLSGPLGGVLGASWGVLERLGGILGRLGASWERLEGVLGPKITPRETWLGNGTGSA